MQAKYLKHTSALIVCIFIFFSYLFLLIGGVGSAYAAETDYSDVLSDLTADSKFNPAEYPTNADDHTIDLIQIAESTDGELFVYTYQPCQKTKPVIATDINMSLSESAAGTKLYGLTLLNSNGVFCKYKVNDFTVSKAATRYYNITSIYRPFDNTVDDPADGNNQVDEKAFSVGQYWQATTQGNTVTYKMLEVDTVEIVNPFTSYIRRNKNQSSNGYFQDNYYVAFSTDRNIEKLLSATVKYRIQDYFYKENNVLGFDNTEFWNKSTFSNEKRTQKEVYCDEVNELQQQGFNLFGIFDLNNNYSWKRIQSSADFVKNAGASSSDNDEVQKLQWVLMFDETSVYRYQSNGTLILRYEEAGQIIDKVTVLRLEFVEDGVTYNLGAISDTVSKDHDFSDKNNGTGDNDKKQGFFAYVWNCIVKLFTGKASGWETFVAILAIVIAVVLVVCAIKFVKWIVSGVFGRKGSNGEETEESNGKGS